MAEAIGAVMIMLTIEAAAAVDEQEDWGLAITDGSLAVAVVVVVEVSMDNNDHGFKRILAMYLLYHSLSYCRS